MSTYSVSLVGVAVFKFLHSEPRHGYSNNTKSFTVAWPCGLCYALLNASSAVYMEQETISVTDISDDLRFEICDDCTIV